MSLLYNHNQSPLVKLVYSRIKVNGKIELVPLELYADGTLKKSIS
ncbi:hypothetical protein [Chlorogloeopsis sp. ULAP02]